MFFAKAATWIIRKASINMADRSKRIEAARIEREKQASKKREADAKKEAEKKEKERMPVVQEKPQAVEGVSIPATEKLKLSITVTDDVWIQLKADGKIISQSVLKKGSSVTWEADDDFVIWTGNAAAMQIDLNGNDLGSPGRGVMKDVIITREGIEK